jgi:maltose/maltodextrin transport system substrate-binding protein
MNPRGGLGVARRGLANVPRRRLLRAASAAAALGAPRWARAQTPPLVVWFTVEGAKAMRRLAERFTAETGVPVVVETPDDGPARFQQAAGAGKGPDVYICAHDRIGAWTAAGLIHAVTPSPALLADRHGPGEAGAWA